MEKKNVSDILEQVYKLRINALIFTSYFLNFIKNIIYYLIHLFPFIHLCNTLFHTTLFSSHAYSHFIFIYCI